MWYLARKDSSMRNHHSSSWFEKTSLFKVQNHLFLPPSAAPSLLLPGCQREDATSLPSSGSNPWCCWWNITDYSLNPGGVTMWHLNRTPCQRCVKNTPSWCHCHRQRHLAGELLLSLKTAKGQENKPRPTQFPPLILLVTCWWPPNLKPPSYIRGIMSWTCWTQKFPDLRGKTFRFWGVGDSPHCPLPWNH